LFLAFSGDTSCDFESPNWDIGFCNWQYDYASLNVFTRVAAPATDLNLRPHWVNGKIYNKNIVFLNQLCKVIFSSGNNYVTFNGQGYILLISTPVFQCSALASNPEFGFTYQQRNAQVIFQVAVSQ